MEFSRDFREKSNEEGRLEDDKTQKKQRRKR